MANVKHTHKLRRHTHKTGNQIYFCALPDCTYKVACALALGKRCVCWRCGEEFIMNEYSIRLAKPHCEKCHNPKVPLAIEYTGDGQPVRDIPMVAPTLEQMREAVAESKPISLAERMALLTRGTKPDQEDEDI